MSLHNYDEIFTKTTSFAGLPSSKVYIDIQLVIQ
jgi:hypothetical protein